MIDTLRWLIDTRWFWTVVFVTAWALMIPGYKPYIKGFWERVVVAELTAQGTMVMGLTIGAILQ